MRYRSTALATLAVAALSVVVATPADAALYSHDRFDFTFAETFDECGITIDHTAAGHAGFSIRTINGTTEAYLGWQNLSAVDTLTNPANGRFFTISNRSTFRETQGTQLEGNVWTFDSKLSGASFTVRDDSGRVVARDSGTLRMVTTYDLLGDGQPGGEQIGDPVITAMNGRFTEVDFCADLVGPLLG
jgi:hypothetical protein